MSDVVLGFKAFDVHELLCHFVAVKAGLYDREGLRVSLLDTTFIPNDQLPGNSMQVACGAALADWRQGVPVKVVFVANTHPMFWLYSNGSIAKLEDLESKAIATYPDVAPPAMMAKKILGSVEEGLVESVSFVAARDDVARLGLLRSGSVGAAVLSSASYAQAESEDFKQLSFFGDALQLPTTGLAVGEQLLADKPDVVRSMVAAHRAALQLVHSDSNLVALVLEQYFGFGQELHGIYCDLVRRCFTQDGRSSERINELAMNSGGNAQADIGKRKSLYDFTFLAEL